MGLSPIRVSLLWMSVCMLILDWYCYVARFWFSPCQVIVKVVRVGFVYGSGRVVLFAYGH